MAPDFPAAMAGRFERLEAQHQRLKWSLAAMLLLMLGEALAILYLLLPVSSWLRLPREVEANRFVLVDERGRARAELILDQGPRLQLLSADGTARATLWVNREGASSLILLDNKNGASRNAVLSAHDDRTALSFVDEQGTRLMLQASKDELGLQTFDKHGKPVPAKAKPQT
jgi:hypothetical protein